MAFPVINPILQFFDNAGEPLSGGLLYTYAPGTTTPKTTWTDENLSVANANPIVLDSAGRCTVFLTDGEEYKFVLQTSAAVTLRTVDEVKSPSVLNSTTGLYPQTAAETTAGVTPTNTYVPSHDRGGRIFPLRYGCVGDWTGTPGAGTDDTINMRKCALVASVVGCPIDLEGKRYRLYSDTGDTSRLWTFTSLDGVTIIGGGAELAVDRAFASAVQLEMVRFVACTNISISGITFTNGAGARSEIFERGYEAFQFLQGCKNVKGWGLDFRDARYGVRFIKETTDDISFNSTHIDLQIKASATGYPLLCTGSGCSLKAHIQSVSCGRSFFCNASTLSDLYDIDLTIESKNHTASVDCLMQSESGATLSGFRVNYTSHETTTQDSSLAHVQLEFHNSTPSIIRDGHVHVDIMRTAALGGYSGWGLVVRKFAAGILDTTDRGHILDNITLSGSIISNTTNQRSFNLMSDATWGAGEFVNNINVRNLTFTGTAQPNFFLASLKDAADFTNVRTDGPLNVTNNATSVANFTGCVASSFTVTNADTTSIHMYMGCKITGTTTQTLAGNIGFAHTFYNSQLLTRFSSINGTSADGVTINNDSNSTNVMVVKNSLAADDDTILRVYRRQGGVSTLQHVTQGAADSGGAGFKLLRVPN